MHLTSVGCQTGMKIILVLLKFLLLSPQTLPLLSHGHITSCMCVPDGGGCQFVCVHVCVYICGFMPACLCEKRGEKAQKGAMERRCHGDEEKEQEGNKETVCGAGS